MTSATLLEGARWARHAAVAVGILMGSLMLANCGGDSDGGSCESAARAAGDYNECDNPGGACPSPQPDKFATFCALTDGGCKLSCLNVCDNPADFPNGSVSTGETCEFDADCGGGSTCDNDVVGGSATCRCIAPPTCTTDLIVANYAEDASSCYMAAFTLEFGVNLGSYWLKRTCRRVDGTCSQHDDDIGIGREFDDFTRLCWVDESADYASGRLCDSDFNFTDTTDSGEYETGLFHFGTETQFEADWIYYDEPGGEVVARCKGAGKAKGSGAPNDPPDCDEYLPFGPAPSGTRYDGNFIERFNCVSQGACVDHDESSDLVITPAATPGSYRISSDSGRYSGSATRSGMQLFWTASYIDPADHSQDYTESGTYTYSDSDNFTLTSNYKIIDTGKTGHCTGKARRNATPPAPDPLPPCS